MGRTPTSNRGNLGRRRTPQHSLHHPLQPWARAARGRSRSIRSLGHGYGSAKIELISKTAQSELTSTLGWTARMPPCILHPPGWTLTSRLIGLTAPPTSPCCGIEIASCAVEADEVFGNVDRRQHEVIDLFGSDLVLDVDPLVKTPGRGLSGERN